MPRGSSSSRVLQSVAERCRALQSVLQNVAVCCSLFQYVGVVEE